MDRAIFTPAVGVRLPERRPRELQDDPRLRPRRRDQDVLHGRFVERIARTEGPRDHLAAQPHDFPLPLGTLSAAISGGWSWRHTADTNADWNGNSPPSAALAAACARYCRM